MAATLSAERNVRLMRAFYFVNIGAGGFLLPFITLFYRRQGLSGTQIGLIATAQAATALIVAPLWGHWSDRFPQPTRLLKFALLGSAILMLILGRQVLFWLILVIAALEVFVSAGVGPLSDVLASTIAEQSKGSGYGSIRLWGSLGWTLTTALGGRLIESFGIYFAFVGYATGNVAGAFTAHFLQDPRPARMEASEPRASFRELGRLILHNRRLAGLALALAFAWLLGSGSNRFEAIYMDELGAGESVIGLANALNAAVELPAMLWADRLLRRFSAGWLLRLAFLLFAVRMLSVLIFPSIATLVLMRVVLGVQFSLYSIAIIGYIMGYAPVAYRVTVLALLTVTLRNLVIMIGSPLSGAVYDLAGAYALYGFGLAGALLAWLALQLARS